MDISRRKVLLGSAASASLAAIGAPSWVFGDPAAPV
jgi:hypothetical protein